MTGFNRGQPLGGRTTGNRFLTLRLIDKANFTAKALGNASAELQRSIDWFLRGKFWTNSPTPKILDQFPDPEDFGPIPRPRRFWTNSPTPKILDQFPDPEDFGPIPRPRRFWTNSPTPKILDQFPDPEDFWTNSPDPEVLDQFPDPEDFGPIPRPPKI
uniref:Uncharacterized protein n=1 Tax=Globodera rostochiensis TaxID=31243 RepID=A0A914I5X0_GLORO